jgi:hypothetical protein
LEKDATQMRTLRTLGGAMKAYQEPAFVGDITRQHPRHYRSNTQYRDLSLAEYPVTLHFRAPATTSPCLDAPLAENQRKTTDALRPSKWKIRHFLIMVVPRSSSTPRLNLDDKLFVRYALLL